jgi:hypothetical protein
MDQGIIPMLIRSIGRVAVLAVALFVLLAGCSNNRMAQVTGTVSLDGQPIDKGSISFIPADGKGATAGSEIKDGKYNVSKVSPGTMLVQIRYAKVSGTKKLYDAPGSKTRDTYTEVLPKKYNDDTELRFDVQPGRNEKNWELSLK